MKYPCIFPALLEALKITKRAAKVGFDWESADQVFAKIEEEIAELREANAPGDAGHVADEIGDLLFAVVNLARKLDVEPETALKKTNRKFRHRFKFIEDQLKAGNKSLDDSSLEEMDSLWNAAKAAGYLEFRERSPEYFNRTLVNGPGSFEALGPATLSSRKSPSLSHRAILSTAPSSELRSRVDVQAWLSCVSSGLPSYERAT